MKAVPRINDIINVATIDEKPQPRFSSTLKGRINVKIVKPMSNDPITSNLTF